MKSIYKQHLKVETKILNENSKALMQKHNENLCNMKLLSLALKPKSNYPKLWHKPNPMNS